jgi:hypothetical protein
VTLAPAQLEALGSFIRSQRKLAQLSLPEMAELTTSPPDTLLEQAGLLSGQGPDGADPAGHVKTAIRADQRLTEEQKAALIAVYHSMLQD